MSRPRLKPIVYEQKKENKFVTKITTDSSDERPQVAYLRAKVKVTPLENKKSYEEDILTISDIFKEFANEKINEVYGFGNRYIFSFYLAEKSVKYHKTSHARFDLYIRSTIPLLMSQHRVKLDKISCMLEEKLISLFTDYNLEVK